MRKERNQWPPTTVSHFSRFSHFSHFSHFLRARKKCEKCEKCENREIHSHRSRISHFSHFSRFFASHTFLGPGKSLKSVKSMKTVKSAEPMTGSHGFRTCHAFTRVLCRKPRDASEIPDHRSLVSRFPNSPHYWRFFPSGEGMRKERNQWTPITDFALFTFFTLFTLFALSAGPEKV